MTHSILTDTATEQPSASDFGVQDFDDSDSLAVITTTQKRAHDISHVLDFLGAATPQAWLAVAKDNPEILMQDHANCEKKAAGTAMNLIFRYEFHENLQIQLAQLVREEMLHYEQVRKLMTQRNQPWRYLSAGRYAKGLLAHKRTFEPAGMMDVLIIGAFIEARSCERFAALAGIIDDEPLARYYRYLLKSESRHFEDYLALAQSLSDEPIDARVVFFRQIENELITSEDDVFRFHSGAPSKDVCLQFG